MKSKFCIITCVLLLSFSYNTQSYNPQRSEAVSNMVDSTRALRQWNSHLLKQLENEIQNYTLVPSN